MENKRYERTNRLAERHIRTAMAHVVREDYSTYHTYYFDPETGAPVKGITQQGNRNGSIWARGQAWGIYGSALSYGYFHDPEYMRLFDRCLLRDGAPGAGILLHGTYAKRSKENGVNQSGVDEFNLWGDYFYMEALMRMRKDWERYW